MKSYNLNNSVLFTSGIYFNSKSCRSSIDVNTRRKTIRRKMMRKLRDKHYMEDKIKIAFCLFVLVSIATAIFIG